METPLQVVFRDMDPSEAVQLNIEDRIMRLERVFDGIISCRVVVELPHKNRQQGNLFNITLDIKVPGETIVINRLPGRDHAKEDVYVAMRDAFNSAQRKLEDYTSKRHRNVKTHEEAPRGRVVKMFHEEGYGFLVTMDGREIYFHRNSVLSGFDKLELGTEVRFIEGKGDEGPQASTVSVV